MAKAELEELMVANAAEWREWLLAHHDSSPGVWLVLTKKGGTATTLRYAEAVEEGLCVGWIDGQARRRDQETSFQRMTPRTPRSTWSFSNVQRVERLEREGLMRPAGLAAVESAKGDGRWDAAYEREANK